ncbi:TPA: hypothetical protein ACJE3M_001439 [Klebsiella quasipneumoniae]
MHYAILLLCLLQISLRIDAKKNAALHNPVIYKARNIGNWLVNGEAPTFIWQIGNGEKTVG